MCGWVCVLGGGAGCVVGGEVGCVAGCVVGCVAGCVCWVCVNWVEGLGVWLGG